jgi:hypothetical protein
MLKPRNLACVSMFPSDQSAPRVRGRAWPTELGWRGGGSDLPLWAVLVASQRRLERRRLSE